MILTEKQALIMLQIVHDTLSMDEERFTFSQENRIKLYNSIIAQQSEEKIKLTTKLDVLTMAVPC